MIGFIEAILSTNPKESLRFDYCLEQSYDSSCGMSVVATALSLYWDIPVSEAELVESSPIENLKAGEYKVSLADMQRAVELHGLSARAFKLDWQGLIDTTVKGFAPIIVHYAKPEKHFALLLGFKDNRAIIVDPARGLETLSKNQFEERYSGNALALASREKTKNATRLKDAIEHAIGRRKRMEEAACRVGKW